MLITKEVEMTWTNNRKLYEPKGYKYTKKGDKFIIKIEDLALNSHIEVIVKCDYCGKEYPKPYSQFNNMEYKTIINKDACSECKQIKTSESNYLKYGSITPNQNKISKETLFKDFENKGYLLLNGFDNVKNNITLEYICNLHREKGILKIKYRDFKQGQGCKYCGIEKQRQSQTTPFDKIIIDFKLKGYEAISEYKYKNRRNIKYICLNHKEKGIQKIDYNSFNQGHGCKYCSYEKNSGESHSNWKGGITPLHNYLREHILEWKKDSLKYCGYKCIFTNKKVGSVHHLYGFDLILEELIEYFIININLREIKINDLNDNQLKLIVDKCLELHYKYGYGICLCKDIHNLFHKEYGYGKNTPQQFKEFQQRYNNGEFTSLLSAS